MPDQTIKKAIGHIERCSDPVARSYYYQPGRHVAFLRTAAGALGLQFTGTCGAEQLPKVIEFVEKDLGAREHFWYGHYYAAHAMHQVGGEM